MCASAPRCSDHAPNLPSRDYPYRAATVRGREKIADPLLTRAARNGLLFARVLRSRDREGAITKVGLTRKDRPPDTVETFLMMPGDNRSVLEQLTLDADFNHGLPVVPIR